MQVSVPFSLTSVLLLFFREGGGFTNSIKEGETLPIKGPQCVYHSRGLQPDVSSFQASFRISAMGYSYGTMKFSTGSEFTNNYPKNTS